MHREAYKTADGGIYSILAVVNRWRIRGWSYVSLEGSEYLGIYIKKEGRDARMDGWVDGWVH